MDLVIDRSKWLRGEGKQASKLLRSYDGKMCCLGIYLEACGVPPDDLRDRPTPAAIVDAGGTLPETAAEWLFHGPSQSNRAYELMGFNDVRGDGFDEGEAEREERIADVFASAGVTVHFVGAGQSESEGK